MTDMPEKSRWYQLPDWWMVILTFVLMAVGVVTIVIFWGQFGEMIKQTKLLTDAATEAKKDSDASDERAREYLRELHNQVRAAQATAKAVQEQMKKSQRAWIQISIPLDKVNITEWQVARIPIHIENIGASPALKLNGNFFFDEVKNGESPRFFHIGQKRPTNHWFTGVLYPKQSSEFNITMLRRVPPVGIPQPITHYMYDLMHTGTSYWVFHGWVTYYDIFGVSHWTRFCDWSTDSGLPVTASGCTVYNRVDNN